MKSTAKRQGRLQHCFLSCIWLLATLLLTQGAAIKPDNEATTRNTSCRASTEANKTTECDVSYLYKLFLPCSSKSGVWAKQSATNASISEVVCNCSHEQCILNPHRKLHNEDSGLYFCRDESNYLYVNVNVLAPPSLPSICNTGCYCGNPPTYDECHMPFAIVNGLQNGLVIPFSMTVSYTGNGPFEVQWLRNGVEIFCGGQHSRYSCKNHTAQVGTTVIHTQIITVKPPSDPRNYSESAGTYRATVTNSYGSNSSITLAKPWCMEPLVPTPLAPPSLYVNVTEGSSANGQCNIEIAKAAYLYICYGLHNETFGDLNKDTNCALCIGNSEGLCATMRAKPHWNIYRTITDPCFSTIRTKVLINHTSVEDSGKIFCVWEDDVHSMQNYANFSLNVERKKLSDLQLAVYVGTPLAALTIAGLVTALIIVVRKKLKKRRRRRRATTSRPPDSDSEVSPIRRQYQGSAATPPTLAGRPSYGSTDDWPGRTRCPPASGYATDTESENQQVFLSIGSGVESAKV